MFKKAFLSLLPFLFILLAWSSNPATNQQICSSVGEKHSAQIVSDGQSRYFVFWWDERGGIYGQKVNVDGGYLWDLNGKKIVDGDRYFKAISDGNGGSYIISQTNSLDMELHRIDSDGNRMGNHFPVFLDSGIISLEAASDSLGNCFISTGIACPGNELSQIIQKINSEGIREWSKGSTCHWGENENRRIISDGFGGCIHTWEYDNLLDNEHTIYCTRYDSSGQAKWIENSQVPIIAKGGKEIGLENMISDGIGGVIVFYKRGIGGNSAYYALRIDASGHRTWGYDGKLIATINNAYSPEFSGTFSSEGNVIIAWTEGGNIIVAKYNEAGSVKWRGAIDRIHPSMIRVTPDKQFGVIVTWLETITEQHYHLMAQRIDPLGFWLWARPGVIITSRNVSAEDFYTVCEDGNGGAVLTWVDNDIAIPQILAQRICSNGRLGMMKPGEYADITASRSGGIAPAEIIFDCYQSSNFGDIKECRWDFGDNTNGVGFSVSHIYERSGRFDVCLDTIRNNGTPKHDERTVIIYSPNGITAGISIEQPIMKAKGRDSTRVKFQLISGNVAAEQYNLQRVKPIEINLAPTIKLSSGEVHADQMKPDDDGLYRAVVQSGDPGPATLTISLDGFNVLTASLVYTWLLPPINPSVQDEVDRTLFKANRSAVITWSANPGELYTPKYYKIYRSTNNSEFSLSGTVNANVFSFRDENLLPENAYTFRVTMVDSAGDESDPSAQVTLEPLNGR